MGTIFEVEQAWCLEAGRVKPQAWQFAVHAHTCWEFNYFVRGRGQIALPDTELHPQQYHLVVYPPRLLHAEMSDPMDPVETLYCHVEVSAHPPSNAYMLLPDQNGDLRWLLQHMCDEFMRIASQYPHLYQSCQHLPKDRLQPGSHYLLNLYTQVFLAVIEKRWESGIPLPQDAIDFVIQFIQEHYKQPLTLQMLASAAQISESVLKHKFCQRMGMSTMRYVQQLRLEEAKCLLMTTDLAITAIAEQVGFEDAHYFSRLIHRETGVSPSAFREAAK